MHISSVTVSSLLDPELRIHRPFHVAPYLDYSSAFQPPSPTLFAYRLSLSPSTFLSPYWSQTPILTTSFQPFSPKRWREAESTREKHGDYSRGTAKKSRKLSRCRQHGEAHIMKRLDRSKDAFYALVDVNYVILAFRIWFYPW